MTELFYEIVFYASPFVFVIAGFVLGWTLKEFRYEKKEKKKNDS